MAFVVGIADQKAGLWSYAVPFGTPAYAMYLTDPLFIRFFER
jgi:hypothetical protein